jgi:hypothetical protein
MSSQSQIDAKTHPSTSLEVPKGSPAAFKPRARLSPAWGAAVAIVLCIGMAFAMWKFPAKPLPPPQGAEAAASATSGASLALHAVKLAVLSIF